jgi:hypothetical protein
MVPITKKTSNKALCTPSGFYGPKWCNTQNKQAKSIKTSPIAKLTVQGLKSLSK